MDQPISKENNQSLEKELIVNNKLGVHARPAAMIVRITSHYSGDVWVEKDGEQINGKSIMGLMMLAAGNGSKLNFLLEGPVEEAKNILSQLEKLFAQSFEEL
ncbi:MAG: HPr family phosphocarrier protein [Opitutales bacterium]|jgi:phosphocarrier protein HPr